MEECQNGKDITSHPLKYGFTIPMLIMVSLLSLGNQKWNCCKNPDVNEGGR